MAVFSWNNFIICVCIFPNYPEKSIRFDFAGDVRPENFVWVSAVYVPPLKLNAWYWINPLHHGPLPNLHCLRDICSIVGGNCTNLASKLYQAYRDWCSGAGRKPQSQTAFKRALEKLNGVYQQRSSSGLRWHGIQPCLAY